MIRNDSNPWTNDLKYITSRYMQDNETVSNQTVVDGDGNTTNILRDSLRIYGSIFLVGFIVYSYLRKRIPRTFAVRQWVPEIITPLAQDQFGYVSWLWNVYSFSEDELLATIGLDAICFLRVLNMGFRLSCVGAFNSVWLIPVYATGGTENTEAQDDPVRGATINILPNGSNRFGATVIAAYIFFGYAMYVILREFRWFIAQRHTWLTRVNVRNYTILIRNIPEELRSDQLLKEHYQRLYGHNRVLEAHVCLHISQLKTLLKKREMCARNLEHALAELTTKGNRSSCVCFRDLVKKPISGSEGAVNVHRANSDTIQKYQKDLHEFNQQISQQIRKIERKARPKLTILRGPLSRPLMNDSSSCSRRKAADNSRLSVEDDDSIDLDQANGNGAASDSENHMKHDLCKRVSFVADSKSTSSQNLTRRSSRTLLKGGTFSKGDVIVLTADKVKQAQHSVFAATEAVSSAILGEEDGVPDDAGFVTFTSLVATHCALQMSQHSKPFVLETIPAPDEPRHIFWDNVGKSKELLHIGFVVAIAATLAICLFWSYIVSFIVNLTDVDYLNAEYPRMDDILADNPWIAPLLSILSPVLLLIFNSGLLPIVLKAVSRFECPASDSLLEASAFWKMAAFTIIQTFFVSLVSGNIIQSIERFVAVPSEVMYLLAQSLPGKSGYFMQLLIVSTCLGTLMELFRVIPLLQSVLRASIGRRLTEKERKRTIGLLRPLSSVDKIYFSRLQSRYLLYFMVLFVYSTISPLVCWFCIFLFLLCGSVYRYQFVFNYPSTPDSGGLVWLYFIRVVLICLIIAQSTIFGFLILKKSAVGAGCMVPLIVTTWLFIIYVCQRHFKIGTYLPARVCLSQDMANEDDEIEYDGFENMYKCPALMEDDCVVNTNVATYTSSQTQSMCDPESDDGRIAGAFDGFEVEDNQKAGEQLSVSVLQEGDGADSNVKESYLRYLIRLLAIK